MWYTPIQPANRLVFRPFLPWFLVKHAALLGLGAICAVMAARSGNSRWLTGSAVATLIDLLVVCHYNAQAIIVHNFTLICRRGVLKVHERSYLLWRVDVEIEQSLLGRVLNYGSVYLHVGGETFVVSQVALIRTLRAVIAQRHTEMVLLMADHRIIPNVRRRDHAA